MKTLAEVMTPMPESVDPEASIRRAAQVMRDSNSGAVPIVDGLGVLVGIVTARDIEENAEGDEDAPVRQIMLQAPDAAGLDTTVDQALTVMTSRQIGWLPVLDNGRLVGMVSWADLPGGGEAGERSQMRENIPTGTPVAPAGS